jgi:hypothetical protein
MSTKHYTLNYYGGNLNSIRVEPTIPPKEETYIYNTEAFAGIGACNCPAFICRIYKKRQNFAIKALQKGGVKEIIRQKQAIRQLSGSCRHEIMILQAEQIQNTIHQILEYNFPNTRWKNKTFIILANAVNTIHEQTNIKSVPKTDGTWIEFATNLFITTLKNMAPNPDTGETNIPDWIWANQTILNRAAATASIRLQNSLDKNQTELNQNLAEILDFLLKRVTASIQEGIPTNPQVFLNVFFNEEKPQISQAQQALFSYIVTGQTPPQDTPISFEDRELFIRFGGKALKFLEIA